MSRRILITGGSGTIGKAFIKQFYNGNYKFFAIGRSESKIHALKSEYPVVDCFLGNVEDRNSLFSIYDKIRPQIVIHAAALKHVDLAERHPMQAVNINIVGSLNVIHCSKEFNVPTTIAISTDKACDHKNLYGVSKYVMERCFVDANTHEKTRFSVCRFGNVAHSNGSVIPEWLRLKQENKPLLLTSKDMNRLMFSQDEAAALIKKCIDMTCSAGGGFILTKKMKVVNMYELANHISLDNVVITQPRPGEKTNEDLISENELPMTEVCEGGNYIKILNIINDNTATRLREPYNTLTAPRMTYEEIDKLIGVH